MIFDLAVEHPLRPKRDHDKAKSNGCRGRDIRDRGRYADR